ncbi:MAG: endonuclease V, partial [Thermodesulfovibrionales bacterium]|nr:endonuclease V [Thermodesulfovibrionales bacterium]
MIYNLNIPISELWTKEISKAKEIQTILKRYIKIIPLKIVPKVIAAVDAAFHLDYVVAVAVFHSFPELTYLGDTYEVEKVNFPYIPGLLCFREGPTIIKALTKGKLN